MPEAVLPCGSTKPKWPAKSGWWWVASQPTRKKGRWLYEAKRTRSVFATSAHSSAGPGIDFP
jgi:hypothetical protein